MYASRWNENLAQLFLLILLAGVSRAVMKPHNVGYKTFVIDAASVAPNTSSRVCTIFDRRWYFLGMLYFVFLCFIFIYVYELTWMTLNVHWRVHRVQMRLVLTCFTSANLDAAVCPVNLRILYQNCHSNLTLSTCYREGEVFRMSLQNQIRFQDALCKTNFHRSLIAQYKWMTSICC